MDIKGVKSLPQVLSSNEEYRLIAVKLVKTKELFVEHLKMTVPLQGDVEDALGVIVVAERKSIDNLGNEAWTQAGILEARNSLFVSLVKKNMVQLKTQGDTASKSVSTQSTKK